MIPRIRVKTSKTPHVDWLREQLGEDAVIRLIGEPVEAIEVEAAGHNERSLGALIGAMPELPARRTNPAREQLREYAAAVGTS